MSDIKNFLSDMQSEISAIGASARKLVESANELSQTNIRNHVQTKEYSSESASQSLNEIIKESQSSETLVTTSTESCSKNVNCIDSKNGFMFKKSNEEQKKKPARRMSNYKIESTVEILENNLVQELLESQRVSKTPDDLPRYYFNFYYPYIIKALIFLPLF